MSENKRNNQEALISLYNEMSVNLRFFVEWRYKSITRYILTITAIISIIGWMKYIGDTVWKDWGFVPFIIMSLCSFIFYRLEIRNVHIHNMVVDYGLKIEKELSKLKGIFHGLHMLGNSYAFILKGVYIGISIISFSIGIILLVFKYF